jgi:glycosyltransferase involved in cell wall biosynthesis
VVGLARYRERRRLGSATGTYGHGAVEDTDPMDPPGRGAGHVGRQLSVGMVSNEIIHSSASRTGGFGYGTRVLIRTVQERGGGRVRYLTTHEQFREGFGDDESMAHQGAYFRPGSAKDLVRYKTARLDLLTLLDYRTHYAYFLRHRPKLPAVIWARDPRSDRDNERFLSLREPGFPDDLPDQAEPPETASLRGHLFRGDDVRPHVFAVSTPYLRGKLEDAYGVRPDVAPHLCTVIPALDEPTNESEATRPTVVSLARLDPQKRPWVMFELARRMPDVDFVMAGKTHANLRWQPTQVPDNLHLVGEVRREEKARLLARAWIVLNTAVHEALPVSWLEALGTGTPLVACLDPEEVVSRFGRAVPFAGGTGFDLLPDLEVALRGLIDDADDRHRRGAAGLEWVRATHNADNFIRGWEEILSLLPLDGRS